MFDKDYMLIKSLVTEAEVKTGLYYSAVSYANDTGVYVSDGDDPEGWWLAPGEYEVVSLTDPFIEKVDFSYLSEPPPLAPTALERQIGGDHYKDLTIQPMEYSMKNGLNACQHTAIKYITRYKTGKGTPRENLEKAIHTIELLMEIESL